MDEFIDAMKCNKTSGLDLMVLMLGDIFGLSTIALIEDRMWKSHDIDVKKADIYCLIYKSGWFIAAKRQDKSKVLIDVPLCCKNLIAPAPVDVVIKSMAVEMSTKQYDENEVQMFPQNKTQLKLNDSMVAQDDPFGVKNAEIY